MKRYAFLITVILLFITSCAPVFKEELMKSATLNPSLPGLNADPLYFEGKLYVLGGMIINTRVTKDGSLVEALNVPVDSRGYIDDYGKADGRFLAFMPKERGILDPLIFRKNRLITIAGIYKGVKTGKLDELNYPYSYFEIIEVRLWEERLYYYPYPYPYHYWWYDPWCDPWWPRYRYWW